MLYSCFVDINQTFSSNLIKFRKMKALSLRDLAAKTGISYRMIFHYEKAPSTVPFKNIEILAEALGVTIADFFSPNDSSPVGGLDLRLVKKIQDLQSLSETDRKAINQHINSLLEKDRLKKGQSSEVGN